MVDIEILYFDVFCVCVCVLSFFAIRNMSKSSMNVSQNDETWKLEPEPPTGHQKGMQCSVYVCLTDFFGGPKNLMEKYNDFCILLCSF